MHSHTDRYSFSTFGHLFVVINLFLIGFACMFFLICIELVFICITAMVLLFCVVVKYIHIEIYELFY